MNVPEEEISRHWLFFLLLFYRPISHIGPPYLDAPAFLDKSIVRPGEHSIDMLMTSSLFIRRDVLAMTEYTTTTRLLMRRRYWYEARL